MEIYGSIVCMELNLSTREIVASNVRAEMARRNRQFGELAEILGVSRPTLRRSMAGKRDFTVTEMEEIARWLNMPLMNLMNTSRAETQSPTTDRSAA